jgi:hypothetical protein
MLSGKRESTHCLASGSVSREERKSQTHIATWSSALRDWTESKLDLHAFYCSKVLIKIFWCIYVHSVFVDQCINCSPSKPVKLQFFADPTNTRLNENLALTILPLRIPSLEKPFPDPNTILRTNSQLAMQYFWFCALNRPYP